MAPEHASTPAEGGPLAGHTVLDLTSFLGGPYAGMLLADLGADIIKLEAPPHGDPSRYRQENPGYSSAYAGINRNKRSVLIDLKLPESRPLLHELVRRSDALIISTRPQSRKALGVDYATLKAINPRLVYCSITGYGETKAALNVPAFDTTAQARSGLLSLVLGDFTSEVKITAMLSDILAGVFACNGVLAALAARARTGKGQEVRTSLLQASLGFEIFNFYTLFAAQAANSPYRNARPAGYLLRGSDDKPFAVHVPPSPPTVWPNFVAAIGLGHLAEDERFKSMGSRAANYPVLHQLVADHVLSAPRAEWLGKLEAAGIACSPINKLDEVFDDPIVQSLGMLKQFTDPWGKRMRTVGSGVEFSDTPSVEPTRAPLLGEHGREIAQWLGLGEAEIERLEQSGVLGRAVDIGG